MKGCFMEHGDEVKWIDVTLGEHVVDRLKFANLRVTVDDFELILDCYDDNCLENHGENLNLDPITL